MPETRGDTSRGESPSNRMTIGEHLDELRRRVIFSLLALAAACILCIWPARFLLEIIARPVILALERHGQPASLLATHPVENMLVYIKVVVIFGVLIAGPFIIYQLWGFVATGLYRHEKVWVYRLVPASIGLFVAGVVFMYMFVLIVSLHFLVGFSGWMPLPDPKPNAFERRVLGIHSVEVPESQPAPAPLPLLNDDPNTPPTGSMWINVPEGRLKVRWPEGETHSIKLMPDEQRGLVTTHFKIGEYLSFVLVMTIAFGLAFQMPLVVLFLARSGIVPPETLRKYRRIVILMIVVIAGILAPPDLLSHLLLSGPMILLFELGLLLAGRGPQRRRPDAS